MKEIKRRKDEDVALPYTCGNVFKGYNRILVRGKQDIVAVDFAWSHMPRCQGNKRKQRGELVNEVWLPGRWRREL